MAEGTAYTARLHSDETEGIWYIRVIAISLRPLETDDFARAQHDYIHS